MAEHHRGAQAGREVHLSGRVALEICIDSVEGGVAAQGAGADRVELCDDLVEGGTTPSLGMLRVVRRRLAIPVHVMIRPRGGDFCVSRPEFEVMRQDVGLAKAAGADGVVFGILRKEGGVDAEQTEILADLARPMTVTFHRAFDVARNPFGSLEDLVRLGIDRVLTSGQQPSALEGADLIADLVRKAAGRILVVAGGGVHERNIRLIVERTGVREVHASGSAGVESPMTFRNERVPMGRPPNPSEYTRRSTDPDRVRAFVRALASE